MVNLRQQCKVINKKRQTSDIAHLCLHNLPVSWSYLEVVNEQRKAGWSFVFPQRSLVILYANGMLASAHNDSRMLRSKKDGIMHLELLTSLSDLRDQCCPIRFE